MPEDVPSMEGLGVTAIADLVERVQQDSVVVIRVLYEARMGARQYLQRRARKGSEKLLRHVLGSELVVLGYENRCGCTETAKIGWRGVGKQCFRLAEEAVILLAVRVRDHDLHKRLVGFGVLG